MCLNMLYFLKKDEKIAAALPNRPLSSGGWGFSPDPELLFRLTLRVNF